MTDKLQKVKHIDDEKSKGINQSRNEVLKEMPKQPWSRRGFLKGALIGASFIAISVLGHSLLKPGMTVADTLPGNGAVESPLPGKARLILVFILDGLRPDSINADDTPNLFRLRQEGVNYVNGHSVFPTVTRVNAAAMATGNYPGTNGIVSNSMYVPEVNPTRSFSTGEYQDLLKLDEVSGGRMIFGKTLGEQLQENGMQLAVVSSGSTGSALLLNPRAVNGVGVLVNGYFDPGKLVAFPADINQEILNRFGAAPSKGGGVEQVNGPVDWTSSVLREFVIPEIKPDVVFNWITEPDGSQHEFGAGSPEALNTIRNDDRNIGLILEKLENLGLADKTNIFVVSDHGFGLDTFAVNVTQELINAGLKAGPNSDDVVVASSSQAILLHVKDRNPTRIREVVEFLQNQEWSGVIFTAGSPSSPRKDRSFSQRQNNKRPLDSRGSVEGTFSLELIHESNSERGADILFTFPWTSDKNAFGVEGTDFTNTSGTTGPLTGNASGHGSMSPWNVRNTFFAWGVDFKRGINVSVPASNVDLTPTILALKGIKNDEILDGRVLIEGLKGGPDEKQMQVKTRVFTTNARQGSYKAAIEVSELGNQRYIDKSWRIP